MPSRVYAKFFLALAKSYSLRPEMSSILCGRYSDIVFFFLNWIKNVPSNLSQFFLTLSKF